MLLDFFWFFDNQIRQDKPTLKPNDSRDAIIKANKLPSVPCSFFDEHAEVIPLSVYCDPVRAEMYVRTRYESRYSDLKTLLDGIKVQPEYVGTYHVPGDGAGPGYAALVALGIPPARILSSDGSQIMVDLAIKKGNNVKLLNFVDAINRINPGDIVIVSHILDYAPDFLPQVLHRGAHVLVYERKTLYAGYGCLRPTGHTASYHTATNYPGYRYNGAAISISHRTMAFSQSMDMYVLMKYDKFVFSWEEDFKIVSVHSCYGL